MQSRKVFLFFPFATLHLKTFALILLFIWQEVIWLDTTLQLSLVCRRPAKQRPQSLGGIEFKDGTAAPHINVKRSKVANSDLFLALESLIHFFEGGIDYFGNCGFVLPGFGSDSFNQFIFVNAIVEFPRDSRHKENRVN